MESELFVGRSEYKFFLNHTDAYRLRGELDQVLIRDAHSREGSYRVKSLYYDTWQNTDYLEKMGGYEARKKIRLRIYDEDGQVAKLEMKQKIGDYQHKYSVLLDRTEAESMNQGHYDFILGRTENTAKTIYGILRMGDYRPVVIIDYDRTAFTAPVFNTRITFDENVKGAELDLNLFRRDTPYQYALKDFVLLEVKFNECLPEYIHSILNRYPLNQVSFSKYCSGRMAFQEYIG